MMLTATLPQQSVFVHEDQIKSLWSPPLVLDDFLSPAELERLKELRDEEARQKQIYGKTAEAFFVNPCWQQVESFLGDRLRDVIGDFIVTEGNFFSTRYPFTVHADTGRDAAAILYKAILIPLEVTPAETPTFTIFFKQRWLGLAANFYKGCTEVPDCRYNDDIFDYSEVLDLNGETLFDRAVFEEYLCHADYSTLTGLEVDAIVEWRPGRVIFFDRCQLHSSDCFRERGIERKCGLSLLTEKAY